MTKKNRENEITKSERLENQGSKNPAISLLAMILTGGGTASLNAKTGKLEIGPPKLAGKLESQIIAQRQNLIRLLLRISCPLCGFSTRMDGQARLEGGKWLTEAKCGSCNWSEIREMPDFPVLDKNGRET